uniref:Uncharacterized protein n=1 Tax=Romanomermis culicivorax TaxID=13658 RepID=A0A915J041_ROMCU
MYTKHEPRDVYLFTRPVHLKFWESVTTVLKKPPDPLPDLRATLHNTISLQSKDRLWDNIESPVLS